MILNIEKIDLIKNRSYFIIMSESKNLSPIRGFDEEVFGDTKTNVTLVGSDGAKYVLPEAYAIISNLVAQAVDNHRDSTASSDMLEINLGADLKVGEIDDLKQNTNSSIDFNIKTAKAYMFPIVEYMEHYKGVKAEKISIPTIGTEMANNAPEWDAKFIDRYGYNREELRIYISTASYLDIPGLQDLAMAKLSTIIRIDLEADMKTRFMPESESKSSQ
jgi:hypothetical protein